MLTHGKSEVCLQTELPKKSKVDCLKSMWKFSVAWVAETQFPLIGGKLLLDLKGISAHNQPQNSYLILCEQQIKVKQLSEYFTYWKYIYLTNPELQACTLSVFIHSCILSS